MLWQRGHGSGKRLGQSVGTIQRLWLQDVWLAWSATFVENKTKIKLANDASTKRSGLRQEACTLSWNNSTSLAARCMISIIGNCRWKQSNNKTGQWCFKKRSKLMQEAWILSWNNSTSVAARWVISIFQNCCWKQSNNKTDQWYFDKEVRAQARGLDTQLEQFNVCGCKMYD